MTEFRTSELFLAAYLICKGHKMIDVIRSKGVMCYFIFISTEDLRKNRDSYYKGAQIKAIEFKNKIRDLKSMIFNKFDIKQD